MKHEASEEDNEDKLALFDKCERLKKRCGDLLRAYRDAQTACSDGKDKKDKKAARRLKDTAHHIDSLATDLTDAANILEKSSELERAIQCHKLTGLLYSTLHGAENASVAVTYSSMGQLRRKQKQPTEAIAMFERALAIFEKAHGQRSTSTADTINHIAMTFEELRKYGDALAMYVRARACTHTVAQTHAVTRGRSTRPHAVRTFMCMCTHAQV